jgi:uncharacterized tellurite resistance protein B-like protein
MLEVLRTFLREFSDGTKAPQHFDDNDYRLAAAALLVHVMMIDGKATDTERAKLRSLLQGTFELDATATEELINAAFEADRQAVDLYHFTRLINRSLNEDGRRRIIGMMWEIVYADGERTEFEDNVVWRAADLLGVSSRERIELRQQVEEQSGKTAGEPA